MKRVFELRGLSEDHHHGLVLARKAKKAAASEDSYLVADVWVEVERRFKSELEPHFHIEETLLAPLLEAVGETSLVRRFHEEHAALRACVSMGSGRTSADLQCFGDLLEKHIRFEERELFQVAQERLSADELRPVATSWQAQRTTR